mgnify:CR=1 FL=1
MPGGITVVAGLPGSGKTDRLLARYRRVLAAGPPGAALWIAPTWRAAAELRYRLLGGSCAGFLHPGVTTFDRFAESVLQGVGERVRPISRLMQRRIIRWLIDEAVSAGRLRYFEPIAATRGLVELVAAWIAELKRLEIWPDHFRRACQARGMSAKDEELLALYEAYQQTLGEHGLYDLEGRFWLARDHLDRCRRDGAPWPRPWDRLRAVAIDGFADFTRTQHEIIELLADRVEEVWITLPLEPGDDRGDLFGKPRATLAELSRRHAEVNVESCQPDDPPRWPAMAHLSRALLADPRRRQPAEASDGIDIIAAAQHCGELRTIAARIKQWLLSGQVRPGDVAVILRRPEESADLVREIFGRFGIPYSLESAPTLEQSPAIRALVRLLRLDLDGWPPDDLLAVARSNYFAPPGVPWGDETVAELERFLRETSYAGGCEAIIERFDASADRHVRRRAWRTGESAKAIRRRLDAARTAIERLAAALDGLPRRAALGRWAEAWQRLAEATGLAAAIASPPPGAAPAPGDAEAWAALGESLAEADAVFAWLDQSPPEYDRTEALAALEEILAGPSVGWSGDESGRVRVLSAQSVRALSVPYLFVAGLTESSFPRGESAARLYSPAEYERLIEAGLPLPGRKDHHGEEMLLFYEVLTRARRRLVLSYPSLDEKGEPLNPTPYLVELEEAFDGAPIARSDAADLNPVPPEDEPLSPMDYRLKAVARALEGDVSLLAALVGGEPSPRLGDQMLSALRITWLRQRRDGFGPAEGVFADASLRAAIAAEFGPGATFSPTHLESYAACPFRFFLERVLGAQPLVEFEAETDCMGRGLLAHAALAALHRRTNEALGRPGLPLELDEVAYAAAMEAALAEALGDEPDDPIEQSLREVNRRVVKQWLDGYREQLESYVKSWSDWDAPPATERIEACFGSRAVADAHEPADPASTREAFECLVDGSPVRLTGRIDRIDTGRVGGANVFNVIDYKTGEPPRFDANEVRRGRALQLPLYAIAAAELLLADRNPVPWAAGYWHVPEKGFSPRKALRMYGPADDGVELLANWEQIRLDLPEIVGALIRGIRRGEFPVFNEDERCTNSCPFNTLCRIGQIRALEKTWQPT